MGVRNPFWTGRRFPFVVDYWAQVARESEEEVNSSYWWCAERAITREVETSTLIKELGHRTWRAIDQVADRMLAPALIPLFLFLGGSEKDLRELMKR